MKSVTKIGMALFVCCLTTYQAQSQINVEAPSDSINSNQSLNISDDNSYPVNVIVGSAEIGVGLIRNQLAPNINYSLTIRNRKGYEFGLSGIAYYMFQKNESDHYDISMNHFLGASYMRIKEEGSNVGVSFRYLLKDTQNDFEGDAFMISTHHEKAKFNISPALIFSNNFKTMYPSLSVSYVIF
jgi:hypothetical protein